MFKRMGCIILSAILCASILSGCQAKKAFMSETEMQSYVDGVWESDSTTYAISNGKIIDFNDGQLDYCWSKFSESNKYNLSQYNAQRFYREIYLDYNLCININYDYENSKITSNTAQWLEFMDDGTAIKGEETFEKISDSTTYVMDKIEEFYANNIEELKFTRKYPNLPSSREVQYNKFNYLGQKFLISGFAELDDYYNWGYDDLKALYFCIRIRPTGGSYTDEWYVYADRNEFAELYQSLLNGSKSVSLISEMWFYDTGSNNMATLVDYKK